MESFGPALVAPSDNGLGLTGNSWPIELIGNTLGFTGPAGSTMIDYQQHGALIIIGGDINSSEQAKMNYDPPAAQGSATPSMLYEVGVRYYNVNVTLGQYAKRSGRNAAGELMAGKRNSKKCDAPLPPLPPAGLLLTRLRASMAGSPSGNIIGTGAAMSGTALTLGLGAADDTINRFLAHRAGGGAAHTTQAGYTTTGVNSTAKAIAELEAQTALVIVAGTDGSNGFADLVLTGNELPPTVVAKNPTAGTPAARKYGVKGFKLTLSMASGTYRLHTHSLQVAAR